MSEQSAN